MFNLGMGEITVILLLALIVIGPKGLPELAASLGKIIRDIRKTAASVKNEIQLDDAVRKPFEELRDAITLSPEELLRRDRIKKELDDLQKKFTSEVQSSIAAATAPLTPAASEPVPELPVASVAGSPTTTAGTPVSSEPAASSVAASLDGAQASDPAAETGHVGSKTLPFGSPTPGAPGPAGLPVPVRAPEGTVARAGSGRKSQTLTAVPPPPPPPQTQTQTQTDEGAGSLPEEAGPLLAAGEPIPAALHAVSLPPPPTAAVHAPPPPPPGRQTASRLPVAAEPEGAAGRQNTTQVLSEEDLRAAATGLTSPPPVPPAHPAASRENEGGAFHDAEPKA